jgi:hypothetical protein
MTTSMASVAHAQSPLVKLSLNLHYNDPADLSEGGQWSLVSTTSDPNGLAAVSAYVSGIDLTGIVYGNGNPLYAAAIGAKVEGTRPLESVVGEVATLVYMQDAANGPIVLDVGRGAGTPGALLITGTFSDVRPMFVTSDGNVATASVFATHSTVVPASLLEASVSTVVRGDSVALDGLPVGDANRDRRVDSSDFGPLALHFGEFNKSWDQGDFNDSGGVDVDDFNLFALNFGKSSPPPVSAIPEATSARLASIALSVSLFALGIIRRRQIL